MSYNFINIYLNYEKSEFLLWNYLKKLYYLYLLNYYFYGNFIYDYNYGTVKFIYVEKYYSY